MKCTGLQDPAVLYLHGAGVQHQHHEGTGLQDPAVLYNTHGTEDELQHHVVLLVADPAVLYLHGAGVDLQYMLCCWLQILQSCTTHGAGVQHQHHEGTGCRSATNNTTCTEDQHQHHVVGCRSCSPVPLMVLVLIFSTCCVVGCRSCSPVPSWCWC